MEEQRFRAFEVMPTQITLNFRRFVLIYNPLLVKHDFKRRPYAGRIAGPGISLKVAPGDQITVEVYAYYEGGSGYSSSLSTASVATAVAGIFGGVSGAIGDPGKIFSAFNQTYTGGVFAGASGSSIDTEPAAYLNMIMFDQNLLTDASLPMSAVKVTSGANFAKQKLTIGPISIPSPGVVYIYVNDNSNSPNWVYFDDLKVTQVHSPFVAGGDYYPFGMAMDDRQIKMGPYRFGYQGQFAEKDSITDNSNFRLRMYDPRFGRWLSTDPFGQFASPYTGMGNNPVNSIDRNGGYDWYLDEVTGELKFIKGATGEIEGLTHLAGEDVNILGNIDFVESSSNSLSRIMGSSIGLTNGLIGTYNIKSYFPPLPNYRLLQSAAKFFEDGVWTFGVGGTIATGPGVSGSLGVAVDFRNGLKFAGFGTLEEAWGGDLSAGFKATYNKPTSKMNLEDLAGWGRVITSA